jgi:hypothetical protein
VQTPLFSTEQLSDRALLQKRLRERRITCRTNLRKAGVQTRLTLLRDCVRDDLVSQGALLKIQADALKVLPGITESARLSALGRTQQYGDAAVAVAEGIETLVYETEEDLTEAKQRLLEKYRQPLWMSLTQLRADRLMHWTTLLVQDLRSTIALWPADDTRLTTANTIVTCLTDSSVQLQQTREASSYATAQEALRLGLAALSGCHATIATWVGTDPSAALIE